MNAPSSKKQTIAPRVSQAVAHGSFERGDYFMPKYFSKVKTITFKGTPSENMFDAFFVFVLNFDLDLTLLLELYINATGICFC